MSKLFDFLKRNLEESTDIPTRRFLGIAASITTIAIVSALVIGDNPHKYFGEGRYITYLSFLWLLISSGLAYHIYTIRRDALKSASWKAPSTLWFLIAMGFLFLSADEVLEIHE